MRFARLGGDLRLLRGGVRIALDFGVHTVEGLALTAELLSRDVYEAHSFRRTPSGLRFVLRNPPLRMGAFSGLTLHVDGVPVPPERAVVRPGSEGDGVRLSDIDAEHPVVLPIGVRTEFRWEATPLSGRTHRVRLDLQSVAIPPKVWLEFVDEAHAESGPE